MDVVIPGTFMTPEEEAGFVALLEKSPPALVIWPGRSFDKDPERAVGKTAPQLSAWVRRNYRFEGPRLRYSVMLPVDPAR